MLCHRRESPCYAPPPIVQRQRFVGVSLHLDGSTVSGCRSSGRCSRAFTEGRQRADRLPGRRRTCMRDGADGRSVVASTRRGRPRAPCIGTPLHVACRFRHIRSASVCWPTRYGNAPATALRAHEHAMACRAHGAGSRRRCLSWCHGVRCRAGVHRSPHGEGDHAACRGGHRHALPDPVRHSTVRERTPRVATLADAGRVREGEHAWMTMLSRHTALAPVSLTLDESDRQPGEAYRSQQMHALGDILPFLHADPRRHRLSRSHRRRYRRRCIRMVEDGTCRACHADAW